MKRKSDTIILALKAKKKNTNRFTSFYIMVFYVFQIILLRNNLIITIFLKLKQKIIAYKKYKMLFKFMQMRFN